MINSPTTRSSVRGTQDANVGLHWCCSDDMVCCPAATRLQTVWFLGMAPLLVSDDTARLDLGTGHVVSPGPLDPLPSCGVCLPLCEAEYLPISSGALIVRKTAASDLPSRHIVQLSWYKLSPPPSIQPEPRRIRQNQTIYLICSSKNRVDRQHAHALPTHHESSVYTESHSKSASV